MVSSTVVVEMSYGWKIKVRIPVGAFVQIFSSMMYLDDDSTEQYV